MQFKSPLSNLSEILLQLPESAKLYQETLRRNEAATRAVLVDPVLRALGWDTANTYMVEVEKAMTRVRADYALYDSASPRIIIEAKSLGKDLNHPDLIMSLVSYAFEFGLKDVFLTDGLIWEHFDNFTPGNVTPTKVLNLATDDPVTCAAYFVQHLDAAKYWPIDQGIDVLSQRVDQLESMVATLQKKILEPSGKISEPDTIHPEKEFAPLTELDNIAGKIPTHFRLPDGKILKINTWKDILQESCKFALEHNSAIPIPFPDRVGRRISLFSLEKPANRVSFITEQYNGQEIFIYLNYDSFNCVANALHILKQTPKEFMKMPPAVILKK